MGPEVSAFRPEVGVFSAQGDRLERAIEGDPNYPGRASSIAAVLHGMLYLVREIRDRGARPDFAVLGAMIYYLDTVPERFHHPKEDQYPFKRLRERHTGAGPLIDRLEEEHRVGAEKGDAESAAFDRRGRGVRDVPLVAHSLRYSGGS